MNQDEFIKILKRDVTKSGTNDVIKNLIAPVGRKSSEKLLKMSEFYNSMDDANKKIINEIIYEAIDTGIFGFLCLIDGVRSVNMNGEENHLKLTFINDNTGKETVLNNPNQDFLHDIYNAE
ncbi:hypothetical protein [Pedobacter heparinus]|uniref:hypothetical protein n=1 Tax=Pedobacter heparinus TaxID=984 RepID=UPI00292F0461|nr:hypothetical protein [Pedobacter heparinus]